jgi:hypothetical protein
MWDSSVFQMPAIFGKEQKIDIKIHEKWKFSTLVFVKMKMFSHISWGRKTVSKRE